MTTNVIGSPFTDHPGDSIGSSNTAPIGDMIGRSESDTPSPGDMIVCLTPSEDSPSGCALPSSEDPWPPEELNSPRRTESPTWDDEVHQKKLWVYLRCVVCLTFILGILVFVLRVIYPGKEENDSDGDNTGPGLGGDSSHLNLISDEGDSSFFLSLLQPDLQSKIGEDGGFVVRIGAESSAGIAQIFEPVSYLDQNSQTQTLRTFYAGEGSQLVVSAFQYPAQMDPCFHLELIPNQSGQSIYHHTKLENGGCPEGN